MTTLSFPLFHRPGTVVFLDDDSDYLEMLALVLPRHWHVKLFLRPSSCIDYLQQEPPFWEADAWNQQELVDAWRDGKPLIPQILGYWRKYSERFALTRVCVVDYSMPAMDGVEACRQVRSDGDFDQLPIVMLSAAVHAAAVRAGLDAGADLYLEKQFSPRALAEQIRELLAARTVR